MAKGIEYIMPVDYMRGNLSGRQSLEYTEQGGTGYDVPDGSRDAATNYEPRLIALHTDLPNRRRNYFQVRTRTTVNMTTGVRKTQAVMGGAGAIYAALVSDKSSSIYLQCAAAKPRMITLRQFVLPPVMAALAAKESSATIANGLTIDNPWLVASPNVPVSAANISKFASVLASSGVHRPDDGREDP